MSCPPDSLNGFANLSTSPNQTDLTTIGVNESPFTMNFAPRGVPLVMEGNTLMEDSANTIRIKGGDSYTLYTTTICKPTSGSYEIYGTLQPSQATLLFTYINQSALTNAINAFNTAVNTGATPPTPTKVIAIILLVPIYIDTARSANSSYLTQIKDQSSIQSAKYPSLETLFANLLSIGYSGCFNCAINSRSFGVSTNVYNFIGGIKLVQADWNALAANVSIPSYLFLNIPISQSNNSDGSPNVTNTAFSPAIMPLISVSSDNFTHKMQYYTVPISPPIVKKSNTVLTTDQYQCYPFDELNNLQTDPATSKQKVVNLGEAIKSQDTQNQTVGAMVSWDQISGFVTIILSCIGAFLLFAGVMWGLTKMGERKRAVAAAFAAGVASVAAPAPTPPV